MASKMYNLLNSVIGKVNKSIKTESQTLTDAQKTQARKNIGAISTSEMETLKEEILETVRSEFTDASEVAM